MWHKKVELTELFYDLVYVYAISQVTGLIHHLHGGILSAQSLFKFGLFLVILINSWMIQTVFTNRFGKNSMTNILMMLPQMAFLLMASQGTSGDLLSDYSSFVLPFALISLVLWGQYALEYLGSQQKTDRILIRQFLKILSFRTISLFFGLIIAGRLGFIVAISGVLISWVLPTFLVSKEMMTELDGFRPINFAHLCERLSLLVIISFGEMIVGIAGFFSLEKLSLLSFLMILIVANLFMFYIVEFDHMIDVDKADETGNGLIYSHYPIFFGLSMVTVSFDFLLNQEALPLFATSFMYLGLLLVIGGVLFHNRYNKESHRLTRALVLSEFFLLLFSYLVSLLYLGQALAQFVILSLFSITMVALFTHFNVKHSS